MQQHPTLFWIKKKKLFLLVLLWLVHMCVPTTPLLWSFAECAVNSNEENWTNVPEKFEWIPRGIQAERPTPGWPAYICHQIDQGNLPRIVYTEPARLQKGHGIWPQVQAGRPTLGRPAPLVGLSPRAFAWCWFNPSTSLSFLFLFKFTLVNFK